MRTCLFIFITGAIAQVLVIHGDLDLDEQMEALESVRHDVKRVVSACLLVVLLMLVKM